MKRSLEASAPARRMRAAALAPATATIVTKPSSSSAAAISVLAGEPLAPAVISAAMLSGADMLSPVGMGVASVTPRTGAPAALPSAVPPPAAAPPAGRVAAAQSGMLLLLAVAPVHC